MANEEEVRNMSFKEYCTKYKMDPELELSWYWYDKMEVFPIE
jgi:hypothetical protein